MGGSTSALYVRGTTVDPARRFAERQRWTPAWERFVASIAPHQRELLEHPIKRSRWYDLRLYASVIDAAARHLSPDDQDGFLTDLGRFVLQDGVNSLYRAYFAIASPGFVLRGSALLWRLFFKGSRLKVIGRRGRTVHVAVQGAAFCSHALCVSISGGMLAALENAGGRGARLVQHRCRSDGGSQCDYHFAWDA